MHSNLALVGQVERVENYSLARGAFFLSQLRAGDQSTLYFFIAQVSTVRSRRTDSESTAYRGGSLSASTQIDFFFIHHVSSEFIDDVQTQG